MRSARSGCAFATHNQEIAMNAAPFIVYVAIVLAWTIITGG